MDDVEVAAAEPPAEPEPRATRERPRFRIRIFSSASDAPRARRPADAIVVVGSLIAVLLCLVPAPAATQLDTAVTDLVQKLPGLFGGVWEVAYDLLLVWSVVLLAATLVARGRKAVFRDLLLALALAFVYSGLAATQTGSTLHADLQRILTTSDPGYLGTRLAIATALDRDRVAPHVATAAVGGPMGAVARRTRDDRPRAGATGGHAGRVPHRDRGCGDGASDLRLARRAGSRSNKRQRRWRSSV